ncbi:MAG: hypothetical protein WAM82_30095 [Thermoanaerobaculia bacterium]
MTEPKSPPQTLSPEVVKDLVKVQFEQLQVHQKELDLEEREGQRNHDFALKALGAQTEDRRDARKHRIKQDIVKYVFIGILVLLGVTLVLWLTYMGKDSFALEISKVVLYSTLGGVGGYGVGKRRQPPEAEPDDDSPETTA